MMEVSGKGAVCEREGVGRTWEDLMGRKEMVVCRTM